MYSTKKPFVNLLTCQNEFDCARMKNSKVANLTYEQATLNFNIQKK